jgi:hypothetical protein
MLLPRRKNMSQSTVDESPTVSVQSIVEYPLPRGKLVLGVRGEPPAWVQPSLKTLGQFLTLPQDWDSYGGRPVDPGCVWAAWQLLLALMREDLPAPSIVPTSRRGVQIEWHVHGIDLEIEIVTPRQLHASFEDAITEEAWEKEITDAARELAPWVAHLIPNRLDRSCRLEASEPDAPARVRAAPSVARRAQ